MEMKTVIWGLLIPFIGTAAGAACVFFLKKDLKAASLPSRLHRLLAGDSVPASSGSCDPGDVFRGAFKYRRRVLCRWLQPDDGAGRGTRIRSL